MSALIRDYLEQLLDSFDRRVTAPIDPEPLHNLYRTKNYKAVVQWIQKSMRLNLGVGLTVLKHTVEDCPLIWIETPTPMPLYGTPAFRRSYVHIYVKQELVETRPFEWLIAGLAHELSHVVLFSMNHALQHEEKAVDLTAMILGYQDFIVRAEKRSQESAGALGVVAALLLPLAGILYFPGSKTVRLGYLNTREAAFARKYLERIGYWSGGENQTAKFDRKRGTPTSGRGTEASMGSFLRFLASIFVVPFFAFVIFWLPPTANRSSTSTLATEATKPAGSTSTATLSETSAGSQSDTSRKPAFFAVGQVWNVEMNDGETKFRGTLQISREAVTDYAGVLVMSYTYRGKTKKLRQDAKIWMEKNQVYVVCSNPSFLQGSASYDADRFDLVVKSPTQLAGKNNDAARNGGWVKMWR